MNDAYRLLSELAREFAGATHDYEALLALIARRTAETFGDVCGIRLLSADRLALDKLAAIHHPDPAMLAIAHTANIARPQGVGEGISGRVVTSGEPVLVPEVDEAEMLAALEPDRREAVAKLRVTSLMVAPLLSKGGAVGVITLTRSDRARPFGKDDLRLLVDVAAHATIALEHARSLADARAARAHALAANEALRASDEAHRLLFDASPLPLFVYDVETLLIVAVNEAALVLFGYTHDEFAVTRVVDLSVGLDENARSRITTLGDQEASGTARYLRKDGSRFVAEYTSRGHVFGGRRARIAVIKDITERYEAEQARALLAAIVESSNDAIVSKRLDGTITSWNAAAERLFGFSPEEAIGKPILMIVPARLRGEEAELIARVAAGERVEQYETVRLKKDGTEVAVSISIAPILDANGAVIGASKTARDLTAQKSAADALRKTEAQLRQAQKMEAVGRLAGGIAHDFNNLLSVILGCNDLVLHEMNAEDPMRAEAEEVGRAAMRAAELTKQLLVFSRQRVIQPKAIDLNDILIGLEKMLRRILGEDISLACSYEQRIGHIRADPSSIEQVIMNLVVNARDAMPNGGKLTIETSNVSLDDSYVVNHLGAKSGPHVMLAVTDTGIGMDQATQARIFEPFFTTKAAGQGTGLGLSTVFGIAQQSGGSVWVYSEPGRGSAFKVYFPRVESATESAIAASPAATLRGTETILLVEDQDQVRAIAENILKRSGYRVIAARNAGEALVISEGHDGVIELMLTDVVMPHMSGAELAKRLATTRPEMTVLFMSGYTDDSVIRHGALDDGAAYLQKPFTVDSLTRKVRDVLNARAKI